MIGRELYVARARARARRGGSWKASRVADFLAERDHEVQPITRSYSGGTQLEAGTRDRVYGRLLSAGVTMTPLTKVRAVRGGSVVVTNALTKAEREIDGIDTVMLAFGGEADEALEGEGREVYVIGDAFAPRRLWTRPTKAARREADMKQGRERMSNDG